VTTNRASPRRLSWAGVTARRMARLGLSAPLGDVGPAGVASLMCGVHAQVMSAAQLSIGRRIVGATRADVQRALWEDRSLVKTFGPRGTVHLLSSAELPMWTGALSASAAGSTPPPPVGFTPAEVEQVIAAIDDALTGAALTVDELTEAVVERAGPWAREPMMDAFQQKWPRWRQLTSTAAQRGVLCFGANRGRRATYARPRDLLPGFAPEDPETALRDLVRQYLHVYGPATPQHFARWLGAPAGHAVALFEAMSDDLEHVEVDGEPAWTCGGDTDVPDEPSRGVCLLPYFDAYVVAAQPRHRLFPGMAATRALSPTGQAGNYPVLLVDGVVGGVWHQRRSGSKVAVTVEPLRPLTASERRQLDDEVELVGTVVQARPSLTIGTVAVGPHA
jgi:hypothetical protein